MRASHLALLTGLFVTLATDAGADPAVNPASGSPARVPDPVDGVNAMVTPTVPALLSAGLTAKADGSQFRATIVPLRLVDVPYVEVVSEAKLSFLTDTSSGLTRSSLSLAYNPFALRGARARGIEATSTGPSYEGVDCQALPPVTPEGDGCGLAQARAVCAASAALAAAGGAPEARKAFDDAIATAAKRAKTCEEHRIAAEWEKINHTFIPMVTVTGSIESYPFGSTLDPNDKTGQTSADLEPFGGWSLEPSLSFHLHERFGVDVYGTFKRTRASGAPHTKLARSTGGGATVSWLFHSFFANRDEKLESADYRKDGFMPGLVVGASGQMVHCDGREQCAKSRVDQWSVTPFFDVRVKPQLQIRFSAPLVRYESVDNDGNDVVPTFTIAGQVGAP